MKANLLMNFSVEISNKKIKVEREFNASRSKVWSAWTDSQILDQWWAPKPWKARTKSMNFREGGSWLYAMVGPNGEEHWARTEFKSIDKGKYVEAQDAFCDSNGTINKDFPQSIWKINFRESENSTYVKVELTFEKLTDLEKNIEMGFKEGFTMALSNLDEILEA